MRFDTLSRERAIPVVLVALSLFSYARLYMLRDVYADDNCWLLGIYLGYDLPQFLASGFDEMRRQGLGAFLYAFYLPYRYLDSPYVVWHGIVLAVQLATPLVFYALIRDVSGDRWIAALAATALVVFPLDHTLPYLSAINYRIALVFGLLSLYLTDSAARRGRWGWRCWAALFLAALAEYVLSEAILGFEAARLLLLWVRLGRPGIPAAAVLRQVGRYLVPFALIAVPLIAYKLAFKPYGMYAGMYSTGFSHFNKAEIYDAYRLFRLGEWQILARLASFGAPASVALGLGAGAVVLVMLRQMANTLRGSAGRPPYALLGLLAAAILAPQLFLFFFAGRPPRLGFDSTHAILMQPGYALLIAMFAYEVMRRGRSLGKAPLLTVSVMLASLCGLGAYFTNLNLDMFREASRQQSDFWHAFRARFPTLPERADFLIDAQPTAYNRTAASYYEWEDLRASYDLELPLNTLYAPHADPDKARRYRVYAPGEYSADFKRYGLALANMEIEHKTHFGVETLTARALTVVLYRRGELLINREIVHRFPTTNYRWLADKPLPDWAR